MAHGVLHGEEEVFEVVDHVAQDLLGPAGGALFCGAGLGGRLDGPVQPQGGVAALVHLGAQVGVAVVHVLEQLVGGEDVAGVGGAQAGANDPAADPEPVQATGELLKLVGLLQDILLETIPVLMQGEITPDEAIKFTARSFRPWPSPRMGAATTMRPE